VSFTGSLAPVIRRWRERDRPPVRSADQGPGTAVRDADPGRLPVAINIFAPSRRMGYGTWVDTSTRSAPRIGDLVKTGPHSWWSGYATGSPVCSSSPYREKTSEAPPRRVYRGIDVEFEACCRGLPSLAGRWRSFSPQLRLLTRSIHRLAAKTPRPYRLQAARRNTSACICYPQGPPPITRLPTLVSAPGRRSIGCYPWVSYGRNCATPGRHSMITNVSPGSLRGETFRDGRLPERALQVPRTRRSCSRVRRTGLSGTPEGRS